MPDAGMTKTEYEKMYAGASPAIKKQLPKPEEAYPSPSSKPTAPPTQPRGKREVQRPRIKARKEPIERVEEAIEKPVGLLTAPFRMVTKGIGGVKIKKPVHPDKLIKNEDLYYPPGNRLSPLGYKPTTRELYFGRKAIEKDAAAVAAALQSGASDTNSIGVLTGLSESRIAGAVAYLRRQGYDVGYLEA